jgi:hypothetical protein
LLKVHRFQAVEWFNKESFEELLWYLFATQVILTLTAQPDLASWESGKSSDIITRLVLCFRLVERLLFIEELSGYQVDKLLNAARTVLK